MQFGVDFRIVAEIGIGKMDFSTYKSDGERKYGLAKIKKKKESDLSCTVHASNSPWPSTGGRIFFLFLTHSLEI